MAGLLGEIYSAGDTAKRRLRGLLNDPAGTIGLGVERFADDQLGLLNLMRNAYPMAGERTVLNSPEQVARFRAELADKGAEQAMAAATVWHGSPHKFDEFDASKIGTGEGAQAYGHGLYLAESPVVAGEYQKKLTDPAFKYVAQNEAKARLHEKLAKRIESTDPARAAALRAKVASLGEPGGALYKVDLPDEHIAKMLDWDKPLRQQAPEVQAAFGSVDPNGRINTGLAYQRWREQQGVDPVAASEKLKALGIPGIRFLDGDSRGTGAGTSNYVVFPGNESILKILERNGQALP